MHFAHGPIVYCDLEFKLRYLKNLKLFLIRVKELFEPMVLRKKEKKKSRLVFALFKSIFLRNRSLSGGGGYFHKNCTWMCLPDVENLTFSIPFFCWISHPSVYRFRKKSTQFCAFYNNLPKIHPICVIWTPSALMKTPRSLCQISWKSAPKGRHIIPRIPCQCENPPDL